MENDQQIQTLNKKLDTLIHVTDIHNRSLDRMNEAMLQIAERIDILTLALNLESISLTSEE